RPRDRVPRARRPRAPPRHPVAEPLRDRGPPPEGAGRRRPPARVVLAPPRPLRDPRRVPRDDRLRRPARARQGRDLAWYGRGAPPRLRASGGIAHVLDAVDLRLLPLHLQLPHLPRPDDAHGHLPDPWLRARRRAAGSAPRGRPRPG